MQTVKYAVILAIALILATVVVIYFSTLGTIIIASTLVAYILDPIVLWGEKHKIPRWFSAALLIFGIATALLLVIVPELPSVIEELIVVAKTFPEVYDASVAPVILEKTGVNVDWNWIWGHLPESTGKGPDLLTVGKRVGGLIALSVYALLFLMICFIMLRDWEVIVAGTQRILHDLTPDNWNDEIDQLFSRIGRSLSKLIRGQFEVSSILAVYYLIAFQLIGVIAAREFEDTLSFFRAFLTPSPWMLMGVITGYLNLIPYLGVPVGGFITGILALTSFQFEAIWVYPMLLATLVIGITVDHKMLTPKVIGSSVSVHELWVYVAIFVGYSSGGVVGVILALPAMTVFSEVLKHSLALWRQHRHLEREDGRAIKT